MKLILRRSMSSLHMCLLFNLLIINSLVSQSSSVCPIGVGMEPSATSQDKCATRINEIYSPNFVGWKDLKSIKLSDDVKSTIVIGGVKRSRQIMANGLKFQIPQGATIQGITMKIEGQSSDFTKVAETEVVLLGCDGTTKGQNKANAASYQNAWSKKVNGADHQWQYGSNTDLWGSVWTADDLNCENFGFQIQVRNITNDTITIDIDQILIEVHYTPLYSFCDDKCLTFYVDKYEQKGRYEWRYPEQFQMVSKSTNLQTIDLKTGTASNGVYTICADIYDKSGNFDETCCRDFLYQNCASSEIKGLVWQDNNDNKLRDNNETTISGIEVMLFGGNGIAIDTVLSDDFGKYHFTGIPVGKYYVRVPALPNRKFVLYSGADLQTNSDITNQNGTGTTDLIQTEIGQCVEAIDLGYTASVNLGDFVWNDLNFNGLQDDNEKGIANVKVYLYTGASVLIDSTVTNSAGAYIFTNLSGNRYYLQFVTPTDFIATWTNTTSTINNSKINTSGRTTTRSYTVGGSTTDLDAGFYKTARLGDMVWIDNNGDGIYQASELPFEDIKVTLTGIAGDSTIVNASTQTSKLGKYFFNSVKPGNYTITFATPSGYFYTQPFVGENDDIDSNVANGKIENIIVSSGDLNLKLDAGLYQLGSLSDFVWEDTNANGIQDQGELGIANVKVLLYKVGRDQITLIATQITNANGLYIFSNLAPGIYSLFFEMPAGFTPTLQNVGTNDNVDSDLRNGNISNILLTSGENNTSYDAGYYRTASIGDFVWEDTNANGIQDSNETGIENVEVILTGSNGFNQATNTDANGKYTFSGLTPGVYSLAFTTPSGFETSLANVGGDDALDSDVINGMIENITLVSGENNTSYDAGYYRTASIGDFVWEDTNANGIQDSNETGIENVDVVLTGSNGFNQATSTDADGKYTFSGLIPGVYSLAFTTPSGYETSLVNLGGDDTIDSDVINGMIENITLVSGQNNTTYDAGYYRTASIGDFVWEDTNANGIQDSNETGIENVQVVLTGSNGFNQATSTDANGKYTFSALTPGVYSLAFTTPSGFETTLLNVGGDDALDSDVINGMIENITLISGQNNTTYDAGYYRTASIGDFVWEDTNANGIQDTGVNGIENVTVVLTGSNGFNQATSTDANGKYTFSGLPPGVYSLAFTTPSGFETSLANVGGDDALDSDIINGMIQNFTLVSGENNTNNDAGYYRTASIGDFVWEDTNANGIQDTGETGIENVEVILSGSNGFNQVTSTDSNGKYTFSALTPGVYSLAFTTPSGFETSLANVGGDDALDSDIINGMIQNFTLVSGENNTNNDAGYYRTASIGDFVWEDTNANGIQDTGEIGIENVEVILTGSNGFNQATSTDSNGKYTFSELTPGVYSLAFTTPSGFETTLLNVGGDDALDSDVINGMIENITLISGQNNTTYDAGYYRTASIGDFVWEDTNANGIQDIDEEGIQNIVVSLTGISSSGIAIDQMTITDANGKYSFANLQPGIYDLEVMLPSGFKFTRATQGSNQELDSDALDGKITSIMLSSGTSALSFDIGILKGIKIGDFVWLDANTNGIQDADENGIEGISLSLVGTDLFGEQVSLNAVTNSAGLYSFDDIYVGGYTLSLDNGADYIATVPNAGSDDQKDSNLDPSFIFFDVEVNTQNDDLSNDIGLITLGSIGGLVWEDLNCNGIYLSNEVVLENIEMNLSGVDVFGALISKTTRTNPDGRYIFADLKPGNYQVSISTPVGYFIASAIITQADISSGTVVNNINFPLFRKVSIGDYVWNDTNMNGIQDADEEGINDLEVVLYDMFNVGFDTLMTRTDENGFYIFTDLKPSTYRLRFAIPTGLGATLKNVGSDRSIDSDINSDGRTGTFILLSNENEMGIDAGFSTLANSEIGDFVWEDANANGIQDADERGIFGVTVTLTGNDVSGSVINRQTTTDLFGKYSFRDLLSGSYVVNFDKQSSFSFSPLNATTSDQDSDANPNTGDSPVIVVGNNEQRLDIDAGLYRTASIGDFVWNDLNKNGLQDAGEPGIAGIPLRLINKAGDIVSTVVTSDFGFYFFGNVIPGDYRIEADVPGIYDLTLIDNSNSFINSDFSLIAGVVTTDEFTVFSDDFIASLDLGLIVRQTTIEGFVWRDMVGDGIKTTDEPALVDIQVVLINLANDTLAVDTTDSNGFYKFDVVDGGTYRVLFEAFDSLLFTLPTIGSDAFVDSDVTLDNGTADFVIALGESLIGVNAGYVRYSSIGDAVWIDTDSDGLQSEDEVGFDGLKVWLLDENQVVLDSTLTFTRTTDMRSGIYTFDKLNYGDYYLRFDLPNALAFVSNNNTDPNRDSDVRDIDTGLTGLVTLLPNQLRTDIDAGYLTTTSSFGVISGVVWSDVDNDKLRNMTESLLSNVTLELFNTSGILVATTASDDEGKYVFADISIGNYFLKAQALNDKLYVLQVAGNPLTDSEITNTNGLGTTRVLSILPGDTINNFDFGYADIVTIGDFVWMDTNNDGLQDTDEPGIQGLSIELYDQQSNLVKSTVTGAMGLYTFIDIPVGRYKVKFQASPGFVFANLNTSDPNRNSKALFDGFTPLLDFTTSSSYTNIDAGYVSAAKIGDAVWLDINGNGIRNADEPGIANIKVKLYTSAGIIADSTLTSNIAGSSFVGSYQFTNVRPGSYYVQFEIPSIYVVTAPNVGTTDTDSDITGANGSMTTATFTVTSGEVRNDIDAGAYLPSSIGDFVWNDINQDGIQNTGEPGIPNITVNLFTQAGILLDTKITDANGQYLFSGLRQRLYYLQFSLPDGFEFTLQYNSNNSFDDSDVDATGTTPLISLSHGNALLDIDAGLHVTNNRVVMGNVWDDINKNGIRDAGEKLIANVPALLLSASGELETEFSTNHAGMYALSTAKTGMHYVHIQPFEDFVLTDKGMGSDPDRDSDFNLEGDSDQIELSNNYKMKYLDAGMYYKVTSKIHGQVWLDLNGNKLKDPTDQLLPNIVVLLFNKNKIFVKSTKTDENGNYTLKGLDAGQYYAAIPTFIDKTYIMFTGNNQDRDSEVTNQYGPGTSRLLTLMAGVEFSDFDFGYQLIGGPNTVVEKERLKTNDILIYPNPAFNEITINTGTTSLHRFQIVNSNGVTVMTANVNGTTRVNVSELREGRYTVYIMMGDQIITKSFIKLSNY